MAGKRRGTKRLYPRKSRGTPCTLAEQASTRNFKIRSGGESDPDWRERANHADRGARFNPRRGEGRHAWEKRKGGGGSPKLCRELREVPKGT